MPALVVLASLPALRALALVVVVFITKGIKVYAKIGKILILSNFI